MPLLLQKIKHTEGASYGNFNMHIYHDRVKRDAHDYVYTGLQTYFSADCRTLGTYADCGYYNGHPYIYL